MVAKCTNVKLLHTVLAAMFHPEEPIMINFERESNIKTDKRENEYK